MGGGGGGLGILRGENRRSRGVLHALGVVSEASMIKRDGNTQILDLGRCAFTVKWMRSGTSVNDIDGNYGSLSWRPQDAFDLRCERIQLDKT